MSMTKRLSLLTLFLVTAIASAGPVIGVYPSIGPDPFGSPATFNAYAANAVYALEHGLTAWGTPGTPTYYQRATSFLPGDIIASDGFSSWMGQVPPPPGFEGQTGNLLLFGAAITTGPSEWFNLDSLTYDENFYGSIAPTYSFAGQSYGLDLVGINYGPDGILGTADDLRYDAGNPGSSSAFVNALYFAGLGAQFVVYDPEEMAGSIARLNEELGGLTAEGTYHATTQTPEPATAALAGLALLLVGALGRKFRK